MRLQKVEEGKMYFKKTKLQKLIEEFSRMDAEVVEVLFDADEYKDAHSAYGSFTQAIKRYGKIGIIKAITDNGKLFLMKMPSETIKAK